MSGCGTHSQFQSAQTLDSGTWETSWGAGWNSVGTSTLFATVYGGVTDRLELGIHFETLHVVGRIRWGLMKQNLGDPVSLSLGLEGGKFFPLSNYWNKYPEAQRYLAPQDDASTLSGISTWGYSLMLGHTLDNLEVSFWLKGMRLTVLPRFNTVFGVSLRHYFFDATFIGLEGAILFHNWTNAPRGHEGFQGALGIGQKF